MQSALGVKKHSMIIMGHATSISLEEEFWRQLKSMAVRRKIPLNKLVEQIDAERSDRSINLSSCLRVYVLNELLKEKSQA